MNGGRILATGETQPFINSLYLQLFVMGNMDITRQKKINELVNENYVNASVLHYFGIKFYQYSEKTLEQVCQERGLNQQQLISNLESVGEGELITHARVENVLLFPKALMLEKEVKQLVHDHVKLN